MFCGLLLIKSKLMAHYWFLLLLCNSFCFWDRISFTHPRLTDYPMVSASSVLGLQGCGGLPHPIYHYVLWVHARSVNIRSLLWMQTSQLHGLGITQAWVKSQKKVKTSESTRMLFLKAPDLTLNNQYLNHWHLQWHPEHFCEDKLLALYQLWYSYQHIWTLRDNCRIL